MYRFECGSPACSGSFTARDEQDLASRLAEHLRTAHGLEKAPKSVLNYLRTYAVREEVSSA